MYSEVTEELWPVSRLLPDNRKMVIGISDEIIDAATESHESVAEWINGAVRLRLRHQAVAREAAAKRQPGPWPGWETTTYAIGRHSYVTHYGPADAEIHYSEFGFSDHRAPWQGASSRPWMARNREDCLRAADGKLRVFATADAARAAIVRDLVSA